MGMLTIKIQSAASVTTPAVDQLRLFVDTDSILKTKDSNGLVRPQGVGTAEDLATTGAPVDVSTSPPPSPGQVLTATAPGAAVWLNVPPASELKTSGAPVVIGTAAPPVARQVLTATSATNAVWQSAGGLNPTAVQSTDYEAVAGDLVLVDISGADVEVDLPEFHSAGDQIGVKMVTTAGSHFIYIWPWNNGELVDGDEFLPLSTDYEWAILMSDGTNWLQIG
jgi:hypothetical protein